MSDGEAPVIEVPVNGGGSAAGAPLTPALVIERARVSPAALLDDDVLACVVALDDLALMRLRQGLTEAGAKAPVGWAQLVAERRRDARGPKAHGAGRPADERPRIRVVQGELPRAVEELCAAFVAEDPEVFRRGDELVTIEREPDRREDYEADVRRGSSVLTRSGTPRVRALPFGQLQLRAAEVAEWVRMDKRSGEWGPCDPDTVVLGAFRDTPRAWGRLPPLKGVVETQFFSPSFRLVDRPGYDEETAHFLVPSCDPGPIDEKPPRAASNAAMRFLWTEMACDIPFVGMGEPSPDDPERVLQWAKALSVPSAFIGVSAVLTLVARTAIIGAVPAHIFEAASQGSGKTLQMNTVAMIATGRAAPLATYPMRDGRPNEEELEKMLAAYALFGARMIAFDNIKGSLGGQAIEKRLTVYGEDTFRILGKTEPRTLPWPTLLMFALNNASMTDDMANRSLISRVESDREDPRRRPASSFYRPDLLVSLRERRPKLVRAALVILRSYLAHRAAGETDEVEGDTMGNFEAWARLVPTAIRWAGGPDILRARPEAGSGSDEEAEAHAALLRGWVDAWNGQGSAFIKTEAFAREHDIGRGHQPDDGLSDVRGAIRTLTGTRDGSEPTPQALGMALRKWIGKIRDGRKIAQGKHSHTKAGIWSVVKVGG